MNSKKAVAFTLIEVLVVIAIIVIVSSIILSTFVRAKGKSLETVSSSNLRQYHAAMHLYASDHGSMPLGTLYSPVLTTYLGGQWIEPPLAPKTDDVPTKKLWTYRLHGFRDQPGYPGLLKDCFDQRGQSIAIVTDPNWTSPQQVAATRGGFYLYVRMDGSVGREPFSIEDRLLHHPQDFPCPGVPSWANFR